MHLNVDGFLVILLSSYVYIVDILWFLRHFPKNDRTCALLDAPYRHGMGWGEILCGPSLPPRLLARSSDAFVADRLVTGFLIPLIRLQASEMDDGVRP